MHDVWEQLLLSAFKQAKTYAENDDPTQHDCSVSDVNKSLNGKIIPTKV